MTYEPVTDDKKEQWIEFLSRAAGVLDEKFESDEDKIFKTVEGDVATCKDLVGNFLATLTGKPVTIK
jgi:hypothetical protein